ncbi:hypothetical protein LJK88_49585 [Paenibacillus sp. P26]|nr:hypothetical protein LJK88_49585 [Paenibacillus sp. P26]
MKKGVKIAGLVLAGSLGVGVVYGSGWIGDQTVSAETSTEVKGLFAGLTDGGKTIKVTDGGTEKTYPLIADVWVYRNSKKAVLKDLKPGDTLDLILNSKNQVAYIKASGVDDTASVAAGTGTASQAQAAAAGGSGALAGAAGTAPQAGTAGSAGAVAAPQGPSAAKQAHGAGAAGAVRGRERHPGADFGIGRGPFAVGEGTAGSRRGRPTAVGEVVRGAEERSRPACG